ncbi:tetratricopeptide repeat protein [bacterium]|nr:tetratricopeptide repeat protein [bacterium]
MQTFKDASKTKVVSARNWARSGFEAMHQGRFQQAKTFFSKAAKDMPSDHRIMANLARSEFQQGDLDRSISVMEQAVMQSDDPALRCELGEMYLKAGRWIAANQHADKAIEKDRHLSAAWSLKGKLAASKGEHQRALQLFQRALAYKAESDEIEMLIAQTYMKLDQPMRALSATETLLNRHPADRQPDTAIVAKSEALLAMQQHPAAIDILNTASNRPDCSREVYFQLGKAQLQAGNRSQARLTLAKGKQRFPDEELFTQLASTLIEAPDSEFASPHRVASVKPDEMTK